MVYKVYRDGTVQVGNKRIVHVSEGAYAGTDIEYTVVHVGKDRTFKVSGEGFNLAVIMVPRAVSDNTLDQHIMNIQAPQYNLIIYIGATSWNANVDVDTSSYNFFGTFNPEHQYLYLVLYQGVVEFYGAPADVFDAIAKDILNAKNAITESGGTMIHDFTYGYDTMKYLELDANHKAGKVLYGKMLGATEQPLSF